jgi:SNF2 family DNA or RNA helicase
MPTLRPSQAKAVSEILTSKLLLADVGAGKTATALKAIERKSIVAKKRVLVVGTKRICDSVWGEEIKIWTPGFSYASVAGRPASLRSVILEGSVFDIVGINFENLIWAINTYGEELPRMFPWLVIDESSRVENPGSKTFKKLKPLLPLFEWRLPMTGTPRANHLYDLWGSAYLADLGKALGIYRQAFQQRWFYPVSRPIGFDWVPKPVAEQEIYKRLASVAHRMPFTHQAPMEIDVKIQLNDKVKRIQAKIDKAKDDDCTIDGVTYKRDGQRVSAKQLQLSSGFMYTDTGETLELHTDKIDALWDIILEAKGEPVMVVYQFEHERDAILNHFPQARTLTDATTLKQWNAGEIEMLLVHPLSCGHGLNAQFSGCDLQVWFTPTHDAELYTQTIGRLNRPGNPKTVRVLRLIMQGTKDAACYAVVAARQRGEHATLDMFE